ncbi:MAG: glycosyltransferase family 1 protein [Acidobacteria bacterium]|nr:glycosyltransferase family 1 protein [Acidobacteriota bacterium]
MKIAFVLIPEKGHVNPYIGPAQHLRDGGHDVVIAAPGDISQQVTRAGLTFHSALIRQHGGGRVTHGRELVELIQDPARLDVWIEELLLGGVDGDVPLIRNWLAQERADAVVIDPLYYAAAIAAHQACLPWASVSNSLNPVLRPETGSALLHTTRRLDPARRVLFQSHGLDPRFSGCDVLSPFLNVAFTTEEFTGPAPADVNLVGPSIPRDARGDEVEILPVHTRHLVYASFGSQIYHWPELFARIHQACRRLGAWLAISAGSLGIGADWEDCHVYRYAPQMRLLRNAHAFITHGGANSVMEAIACGVPMLVSPMCNDQFHQAWFVERAGIGRVDDLRHASADRIAEHLGFLLSDAGLQQRLAPITKSYQRDGAREAARLITEMR